MSTAGVVLRVAASRTFTRGLGALAAPMIPWLSRRESFRTLPERMLIESEPRKADLIHVLGGGHAGPYRRVDHGVLLYHRGLAPRLLLTGSEGDRDWAAENAGRARALGVPEAALVLDPRPRTTRAEARALRGRLPAERFRTVLLVTEAFHAGRAARIFRRALEGTTVEIVSCPADLDRFPPERWWELPDQRALLLGEAARLILARVGRGA